MGRQLEEMSKTGEMVEFQYNANGLRVKKESTSRGVTEYILRGRQIAHLTRTLEGAPVADMHFWYDAQGKAAIVSYNGKEYLYVYNVQGDVVALLDKGNSMAEVVEYHYDAWGRQVGCTGSMADSLGRENLLRYRGYVYDEETGLYYLRSRYYNPVWGRFVNADTVLGEAGALLSHNVFGYCRNNPVVKSDPNGQMEGAAAGLFGINPLLGIAAAMVMALVYAAKQITKNKTSGMPKSQSRSAENVASQQGYITATTVDEATDVLRNNSDGDRYWLASVNPEKGMILIGPPVSDEKAKGVVLSGLKGADIFAINSSTAYDLAYDAAMEIGGEYDLDSAHVFQPGFQLPHYHLWDALGKKYPAHIPFIQ